VSFSVVVLIARIGLVLALYLFLLLIVRAMARDLRRAARPAAAARSRQQPDVPAQLVVLAQGKTSYQVGQRFALRSQMVLGRDGGCDIPVEDDFVSTQHLKLVLTNGVWLAHDMNSTNGTRINGSRLRGTAPLKAGDLLDLGRLQLRFTVDR